MPAYHNRSDKPVKLKYRDIPGQIVISPFIEGYAYDDTVDWSKLGHYYPLLGNSVTAGTLRMTLWYKKERGTR